MNNKPKKFIKVRHRILISTFITLDKILKGFDRGCETDTGKLRETNDSNSESLIKEDCLTKKT